jgi:hypothetical protein
MKLIIVLTIFLFVFNPIKSFAQPGCKIKYEYDISGNRILRQFKCDPVIPDPDEESPHTILTLVYPNPTVGVINCVFSVATAIATFEITAVDGSLIQSYDLTQQSTMVTFDISAQVPGTYFITVWAFSKVETYTVIKM